MKHTFAAILLTIVLACGKKKASLSGNIPVKVNDFVAAFKPVTLPYGLADSSIGVAEDTVTISKKVFGQFVPDTVLAALTDTHKLFIVKPVARIEKPKDKEYYLLANIIQHETNHLILLAFSKKNKFLSAKFLFDDTQEEGYQYSLMVNKEPTFIVGKEKISTETKQLQFTRLGWVYAETLNNFMVVLNDSNEDVAKTQTIINPIDTLPQKNKLSGEYVEDAKNFISIRDGRDANTYLFFIHFEKKGGSCVGELKGEMKMKDEKNAVYNISGDPCIVDFVFDGNEIKLKEQGSCGNRRGIECFFNDTFKRKKEKPQPKTIAAKSKTKK